MVFNLIVIVVGIRNILMFVFFDKYVYLIILFICRLVSEKLIGIFSWCIFGWYCVRCLG